MSRTTRTIMAAAGAAGLLAVPAGASAATRAPAPAKVTPAYSGAYSTSVRCATWHGSIAWGTHPLGAHYLDVDGTLKSTCRAGWAKLHLHYDTVSNPKDVIVGAAENGGATSTPYATEDDLFAYKDIYVELCSENRGRYQCGSKEGPQ